jgi:DNA mismatch repair protein MutL
MNDIIHLLPDSVANQIAAGEVIQRPASVIKELVENAIDAGARNIQVILKDAGRTLIQVTDDGKGMSETDARMAFERHATSKIKSAADLFALHTMGFRGEALASVAAVAQVELRTRRPEDELGTVICIAGSQVESQLPSNCPAGTSFFIKNLFFNVPARRKFLKSNETELRHIITEFIRIALVYPEHHFTLTHNDTEIYELAATNRRQRIAHIFGSKNNNFSRQLLPIETSTTLVNISGYVGTPETALRNSNQYFFVNGRYMRHPYFHKAVMQAYDRLIGNDVSPNYFIYFDIDPGSIDVNIHPTKTEIKFENEAAIWPIITAAVKEMLGKSNAVPSIEFDVEGAIDIPVIDRSRPAVQPQVRVDPTYNPFQTNSERSQHYSRPPMNWETLYQDFEKPAMQPAYFAPPEINQEIAVAPSQLSAIADQPDAAPENSNYLLYKGRYIITGGKSGIMLIDKQRAHIRVLFEQFIDQLNYRRGISQQLLFPEIVELNAADALVLENAIEELECVGLDIALFGKHTFSINGIPAGLEGKDIQSIVGDIIDCIKNKDANVKEVLHENIALTLAKASAVGYGQQMTFEEMDHLVGQLFACSNANYTPDGKRIVVVLTNEEIEKKF